MKIYHYTQLNTWDEIKEGSYKLHNIPELAADRRIGKQDSEAFSTGAVFALLEPSPKNWKNNPHFNQT